MDQASGSVINITQLTFYLERHFTQQRCLDFNMYNAGFVHNTNDIQSASRYYYNKDVSKLDDNEILELIAMSQNPHFLDKKNHPWELAKTVDFLKRNAGMSN